MAFNYNGNAVSNLNWNGNPVTTLNFNGVQVWTYVPPVEPFWIMPASNSSVGFKRTYSNNSYKGSLSKSIEYSFDKTNWTSTTVSSLVSTSINVSAGQKIYFRSSNTKTFKAVNSSDATKWCNYGPKVSGNVSYSVGGQVMSLFNDDTTLPEYALQNFFRSDTYITDASSLSINATTLSGYCCKTMFWECTALISAPSLPATTLAGNCYNAMFYGCTALTSAPSVLPATTMVSSCYSSMFYGCTSLQTVPVISATTLAGNCFASMFSTCTSLNTLPAINADGYAFFSGECATMFYGCSLIKMNTSQTGDYVNAYRIPMTGSATSTNSPFNNMFASTGGSFKGTPTVNTTYYTSNTIIS